MKRKLDKQKVQDFNTNLDYWNNRYKEMKGINVVGRFDWSESEYKSEKDKWASLVGPFIEEIEPKKVLDFGCGIGRWVQFFEKYGIKDYFGCDIVEKSIDLIKTNFPDIKNISLINETNKIPFSPNKFDLIWTCTVLQHIIDDNLLNFYIEQFYKRLKKDGHVLCVENITNAPNSDYITFRSFDEYKSLFENQGFKCITSVEFEASNEPHMIMLFEK